MLFKLVPPPVNEDDPSVQPPINPLVEVKYPAGVTANVDPAVIPVGAASVMLYPE